jgi:predicted dinucleotide-utilizing enzyme
MNNTLGIEYAYTRIHKLEVEALAYKDKIAELARQLAVKNEQCQVLSVSSVQDTEILLKFKATISKLNAKVYLLGGEPISIKELSQECRVKWDSLADSLEDLKDKSKGGAE